MQPNDDAIFGFLVENSPDGHFILVDSAFVYLNASAQAMFGVELRPGQSISVYDIIDAADHDRARKNQSLRINGVLKGAETYQARRRNGEVFPIEVHAAPLKLRGRKGLHGVIRDVTARQVMAGRLEELQREGLVTRLAAGIAHDFNNLLAVIQTNTEVAQRAGSGTEVNTRFKSVLSCSIVIVPPARELVNPPVPLAAARLRLKPSASKPRIEPPPVTRAIVQL